ncbi:hypothetical protein BB559_002709 [Furculomyces boomerangus]|uniref:Uncharacterized protein n=1 Tax=Furculomyces boomerangus TaxID=61424 RepID=A0A2T9YT43_9FUNG|nr:hypothetical protein BB559_002709 [Furculomyces boomerangus]
MKDLSKTLFIGIIITILELNAGHAELNEKVIHGITQNHANHNTSKINERYHDNVPRITDKVNFRTKTITVNGTAAVTTTLPRKTVTVINGDNQRGFRTVTDIETQLSTVTSVSVSKTTETDTETTTDILTTVETSISISTTIETSTETNISTSITTEISTTEATVISTSTDTETLTTTETSISKSTDTKTITLPDKTVTSTTTITSLSTSTTTNTANTSKNLKTRTSMLWVFLTLYISYLFIMV